MGSTSYFGAEHEILPDRHFFSESTLPYRMLKFTFEADQKPEEAPTAEVVRTDDSIN